MNKSELTTLRNRAKALGYQLRRRGTKYEVFSKGGGCRSTDTSELSKYLDMIEGKVAFQYCHSDGTPVPGINNDEAVARYNARKAAQPGSVLVDSGVQTHSKQ